MLTIEITEEVGTPSEMADMLRHIANLVEEGNISGYSPNWRIEGEEEPEEEENDDMQVIIRDIKHFLNKSGEVTPKELGLGENYEPNKHYGAGTPKFQYYVHAFNDEAVVVGNYKDGEEVDVVNVPYENMDNDKLYEVFNSLIKREQE